MGWTLLRDNGAKNQFSGSCGFDTSCVCRATHYTEKRLEVAMQYGTHFMFMYAVESRISLYEEALSFLTHVCAAHIHK